MTVATAFDPTTVTLTERAADKVRELLTEEENLALKLRVFITGGGCSCFQYGFSFDEDVADDDTIEELVVTAQKREQALLDVPMSVSAVTAEQIAEYSSREIDYTLARIDVEQQATVRGGRDYEPFTTVRGLRCWPGAPLAAQLVDDAA